MTCPGLPPRYEPIEELAGSGRSRAVLARDRENDREVVVKLFGANDSPCSRGWREAAILSQVNHPGVVTLLDEGRFEGIDFLVTPRIEGTPFPGHLPPVAQRLEHLAHALAEIIAHVHACGVVHGDLKPSNILVDAGGQITLIDFDLSLSARDTESHSLAGGLTGSLATMSPEQLRGAPASAACDCYALGVLLFEAAARRPPHPTDSMAALMRARLGDPSVPLDGPGIEASPTLRAAIEGLMHPEPQRRLEHLDQLLATSRPTGLEALSDLWLRATGLGDALGALPDSAGASLRAEAPLDAADLMELLRRALRPRQHMLELRAAQLPFESLPPDWRVDLGPDLQLNEVRNACHHALHAHLSAGHPVLARPDRLDPWTAELLTDLAATGPLFTVVVEPEADLCVSAPCAEDLIALFEGSPRIFEVPQRAARVLHERSGGSLRAMAALLQSWRRRGLGTWTGARFTLPPHSLALLETHEQEPRHLPRHPSLACPDDTELLRWVQLASGQATEERLCLWLNAPRWSVQARIDDLEGRHLLTRDDEGRLQPMVNVLHGGQPAPSLEPYHRAIAAALERGDPQRFYHLLRFASAETIGAEGCLAARALDQQGRSEEAIAILRRCLLAASRCATLETAAGVLRTWAALAMASGQPAPLEAWLFRVEHQPPELLHTLARLIRLVELARHSCRSRAVDDIEPLRALGSFDDPELELRRQMYILRACQHLSLDAFSGAIEATRPWAEHHLHPEVRGSFMSWQAMLAFHRHDFERAAELHARAAHTKARASARQSSAIAEAFARMEAGDHTRALALAEALLPQAHALHQTHYVARLHYLLRANAYRLGIDQMPEPERVTEVALLALPDLSALVALTEAVIAWRHSELPLADELTLEARHAWERTGHPYGALLAAAFARFLNPCSNPPPLALGQRLFENAPPRIALQGLALLTASHDDFPRADAPWWQLAIQRCLDALPPGPTDRRLEILSVDECLALSHAPTTRNLIAPMSHVSRGVSHPDPHR